MNKPIIELRQSERRVATALAEHGLPGSVIVLDQLATTAQMAAEALGVKVGRIVKSLVFSGAETATPHMLLVSGANRVHERRVGRLIGEKLARADAGFVRNTTGFAIGGVSPLGHLKQMSLWIDEDLFAYQTVWAAAGNARSVFEITPHDLERVTRAKRINVT